MPYIPATAVGTARIAAQAVSRRATSRSAPELWSIQMEAYGGPGQPSPTIAQCPNGGYDWLQVKCHGCETGATVRAELSMVANPIAALPLAK
jgi:hypothetical protein